MEETEETGKETGAKTAVSRGLYRGHGPAKMEAENLRTHTVSSRLNLAELVLLDEYRKILKMQRGEYLRTAALNRLPQSIPALNREAWLELAKAAGNLNQIARKLNEDYKPEAVEIIAELNEFRRALIGAKDES